MAGAVVVVSTGGTIAMRPDPATGKLVPAVSGPELVELLAWPEGPQLEVDDFVGVPSFDVHGELALALAKRVARQARRADVAGIVVTHGTDTMEETVYLVDRLLDADTPVVLTGAQRGADQPDGDGPRNFRDAVQDGGDARRGRSRRADLLRRRAARCPRGAQGAHELAARLRVAGLRAGRPRRRRARRASAAGPSGGRPCPSPTRLRPST